jgi:hypothetical protein
MDRSRFAPAKPFGLQFAMIVVMSVAWAGSAAADEPDPGTPTPQVITLDWARQGQSLSTGLLLADLEFPPNPHLGLAFPGSDVENLDLLEDCGMGIVRMDISWALREPSDGAYSWRPLDQKVMALHSRGIDLLFTYISDAPWATLPTTNTARNRVPADMQDWVDFIAACVERYDLDGVADMSGLLRPIRYHQFFNEWPSTDNQAGGWAGDIDEFITCMNASYQAVKSANLDTEVVLGGIPAGGLDAMVLSAGLVDYTVFAYWTPESITMTMDARTAQAPSILESVARRERVLQECQYDAADLHLYGPVEFNGHRIDRIQMETGTRSLVSAECGGPNLAYDGDITHEEHFLTAMEMNLHALSRGVEFCLWFMMIEREYIPGDGTTWGNSQLQLIGLDQNPKGGYWAYHLLAAVLEGMESVVKVAPGAYMIERSEKPPILVAWQKGSTTTLQLPGGFQADMMMRVTNAQYGTFDIEATPQDGLIQLGILPVVVSPELPGNLAGDLQPSLDGLDMPILF